jgi:hypothetical protein
MSKNDDDWKDDEPDDEPDDDTDPDDFDLEDDESMEKYWDKNG